MARNVEIKARIASVEAVEPLAAAIATAGPTPIAQDDSFFRCANGRLKLRAFADGTGELIFYQRPDRAGPKLSAYQLVPTAHPGPLRDALAAAHGLAGRVVKQRTLYLVGRTRVHLDRVHGLGDFLELEVVLSDDEAAEAGQREAEALLAQLGVRPDQLVEGAYVDLLAATDA